MADIDYNHLSSCLTYEEDTGALRWLERPSAHFKNKQAHKSFNTKYAGKIAGTKRRDGYVIIRLDRVNHCAHRLAWILSKKVTPSCLIDHIDRNPSNNRISNLREASHAQNMANAKLRIDNKTGVKGVQKTRSGYSAFISKNGKNTYIGCSQHISCAETMYRIASSKWFGEFSSPLRGFASIGV